MVSNNISKRKHDTRFNPHLNKPFQLLVRQINAWHDQTRSLRNPKIHGKEAKRNQNTPIPFQKKWHSRSRKATTGADLSESLISSCSGSQFRKQPGPNNLPQSIVWSGRDTIVTNTPPFCLPWVILSVPCSPWSSTISENFSKFTLRRVGIHLLKVQFIVKGHEKSIFPLSTGLFSTLLLGM